MPYSDSELQEINKKEFVTKKEFIAITKLGNRTVEKFLSKMVNSDSQEDEKYFSTEPINGRENAFRYVLNRKLVLEYFAKNANRAIQERMFALLGIHQAGQQSSADSGLLGQTVNMLEKQLEAKDSQIKSLQELLMAKEAVLGQLQSRMLQLETGESRVQEGEVKKKRTWGLLHWLFK